MKALSIRQPWAWLIVNGLKDIENRTWSSKFRGAFYVHASQKLDGSREEREALCVWVWERFGVLLPADDELPVGGIVGSAHVVGVVEYSRSPWFKGPIGLVLDHAKPMPFRPYKGRLGFFDC
jgi:hypothetical protein